MDEEKPPLTNSDKNLPESYGKTPPPSYEQSAPSNYGLTPPPSYGQTPPPNYAEPSTQVIVNHVSPIVLGPEPARVTCPSCYEKVTTALEIESSTKTHLIALLLFLAFFPLTCLPYFIDSCKSKNHYCPNCGTYLGRYEH